MSATLDFGNGNGPVSARRPVSQDGAEGAFHHDPSRLIHDLIKKEFGEQIKMNIHPSSNHDGDDVIELEISGQPVAVIFGRANGALSSPVSDADACVSLNIGTTSTRGVHLRNFVRRVCDEAIFVIRNSELAGFHRQVTKDNGSFVRYDADGKIHCDGAPAVRDKDGNEFWFEHGRKLEGPKPGMDQGPISAGPSPRT